MVRSKISLQLIADQRRRNATFMKRRMGLKKKAKELSMLCDIPTLLVLFGPESQVEVWPEDVGEACGIIDRYQATVTEDIAKRTYDIGSFFGDAVMKRATSEEKGMLESSLYCRPEERLLDVLPESSLMELERTLDTRLKVIEERMEQIRFETSLQGGDQGTGGWQDYGEYPLPYDMLMPTAPGKDEDPAAVNNGLHPHLLEPTLGGAITAPLFCFQPYADVFGTANDLGSAATLACDPYSSAAAPSGYLHRLGGYVDAQAYQLSALGMKFAHPATATSFMPPRPAGVLLDYNSAANSTICAGNGSFSSLPLIFHGDVVSRATFGGNDQAASNSSGGSFTGDTVHHGDEINGDMGFLREGVLLQDGGHDNPWGGPAFAGYQWGTPPAAAAAASGPTFPAAARLF